MIDDSTDSVTVCLLIERIHSAGIDVVKDLIGPGDERPHEGLLEHIQIRGHVFETAATKAAGNIHQSRVRKAHACVLEAGSPPAASTSAVEFAILGVRRSTTEESTTVTILLVVDSFSEDDASRKEVSIVSTEDLVESILEDVLKVDGFSSRHGIEIHIVTGDDHVGGPPATNVLGQNAGLLVSGLGGFGREDNGVLCDKW